MSVLADAAGRSRRSRRPSGDDREGAILATAERLLEDHSLHDISVDDLARGAGISRPTFYFYFPSKEAVVLSLLDRLAEEARQRRAAALEHIGDDPPELWRQALTSVWETFRAHRSVVIAAAQLVTGSDDVAELWSEVIEGFVADTAAAIESERARGVALGGIPARRLAIALNLMNERVFHTALAGQEPAVEEDEAVDTMLVVWSRAVYGNDSLGAGA